MTRFLPVRHVFKNVTASMFLRKIAYSGHKIGVRCVASLKQVPPFHQLKNRTIMSKLSHQERTAADPRQEDIHLVRVHSIEYATSSVRLIKLRKEHSGQSIRVRSSSYKTYIKPWTNFHVNSVVLSRPMARCLRPRPGQARWIYDYIHTYG